MTESHPESLLDVSGLLCPLPVLKARKRLNTMKAGEILLVIATDPMTAIDIPHFCTEQSHELVEQSITGDEYRFKIRKS